MDSDIERIKDAIIEALKDAGMLLSANEAKEWLRYKQNCEPLMKQCEVASLLGVSDQTIMRLRNKGLLSPTKIINNRPYYNRNEIIRFKNGRDKKNKSCS